MEEEAREILRSALSSVSPTKVGTMIGAKDLFIAAHARSLDLTLVTHNTREFSPESFYDFGGATKSITCRSFRR